MFELRRVNIEFVYKIFIYNILITSERVSTILLSHSNKINKTKQPLKITSNIKINLPSEVEFAVVVPK